MADTSKDEQKNLGGRPLAFKTVEELDVAIQGYFDMCDPHQENRLVDSGVNERGETIFLTRKVMTEQQPYTVSGLARALGISRETLVQYKKSDRFSDSVLLAYDRCHEWAEKALYSKSATGAAFSLKNNWGWRDKQEIDHTTKGQAMPLLGGTTPMVDDDDEPEDETPGKE